MFLILAHHKLFSSSDRSFLILAEEEFNGLPNDVSKSGYLALQASLSECLGSKTVRNCQLACFHTGNLVSFSQIQPKWNTSIHSDRTSLPSMSYTLAVNAKRNNVVYC